MKQGFWLNFILSVSDSSACILLYKAVGGSSSGLFTLSLLFTFVGKKKFVLGSLNTLSINVLFYFTITSCLL